MNNHVHNILFEGLIVLTAVLTLSFFFHLRWTNLRENLSGLFRSSQLVNCTCEEEYNESIGLSSEDRDFLIRAANNDMLEIKMGEIASDNGTGESIRLFGMRMASEHTRTLDELKALGDKKNINLPNELDTERQSEVAYLDSVNGYTLDTAYVNSVVVNHQRAIDLFLEAKEEGGELDIREYFSKCLSHSNEHLRKALLLRDSLKESI